ncbi:GAF domain-containing protein [Trichormus azollae]|uniref:GAF domain-containing protein n=1 Tax=Trichormus azollae TaxID=1164 RepID=UPI00325C3B0A
MIVSSRIGDTLIQTKFLKLSNLSPCHIEFLMEFQIKANLVVPILVDDSLWGLLIAHSCNDVRE